MKRFVGFGAGCLVVATALAVTASPARAQIPPEVTITFKLTLNGTVPAHDSFVVNWAENGIELCNPCSGNGHTYAATMAWPKGTTPIQFVFARFSSPTAMNAFPKQRFGQQTVIPTRDRTVSAFFTYGSAAASIPTPATGGTPAFGLGTALVVAGGGSLLLATRRRRTNALSSRP